MVMYHFNCRPKFNHYHASYSNSILYIAYHFNNVTGQKSLHFSERLLTISNNSSQFLPLQFTDDDIALEQLEVVRLEMTAVSSTGDECNIIHIEPHKTTIIYVEDDDSECTFRLCKNHV